MKRKERKKREGKQYFLTSKLEEGITM